MTWTVRGVFAGTTPPPMLQMLPLLSDEPEMGNVTGRGTGLIDVAPKSEALTLNVPGGVTTWNEPCASVEPVQVKSGVAVRWPAGRTSSMRTVASAGTGSAPAL